MGNVWKDGNNLEKIIMIFLNSAFLILKVALQCHEHTQNKTAGNEGVNQG